MTAKKKAVAVSGEPRKLRLKKETIRDLDVGGKAKAIKGGNKPVRGVRTEGAPGMCTS